MKNILITGANGQLGKEIMRLEKKRTNVFYTDIVEDGIVHALDICSKKDVTKFLVEHNIGTIVNCAAYTDVERAEDDPELCKKVNVKGVSVLAQAAKELGAALIHISTDYVFDGAKKWGAYRESDRPNPLSVYGSSKYESEREIRRIGTAVVIIRTSVLDSPYLKNFVKTMITLGGTHKVINVVNDQIGSPTYAADLAKAIIKIIPKASEYKGEIYHFSNEGSCSWQTFATYIMTYKGLRCRVNGISSADYPQKATRPQYSYLCKEKIVRDFGVEVPLWKDSLKKCLRRMQ